MRRVAEFFRAVAAAKRPAGGRGALGARAPLHRRRGALLADVAHRPKACGRGVAAGGGAGQDAAVLPAPGDFACLIRAGLLHDIGKIGGDVTLWQRVAIVLVQRLSPKLARALAERGKEDLVRGFARSSWGARWRRAFYTQSVHAERGAAMAKMWGVEEEVLQLIRWHHQPQRGGRLLQLLSQADG